MLVSNGVHIIEAVPLFERPEPFQNLLLSPEKVSRLQPSLGAPPPPPGLVLRPERWLHLKQSLGLLHVASTGVAWWVRGQRRAPALRHTLCKNGAMPQKQEADKEDGGGFPSLSSHWIIY